MCDDLTNNDACDYDGGDCCGDSVNEQYCNECTCHETGETANTANCPSEYAMWVGDTFCDDSTNIEGVLMVKQKRLWKLYTCTFSNFSCMFLNPNNFFQFEF